MWSRGGRRNCLLCMRTEFCYHDAISTFINDSCETKDGLVCINSKTINSKTIHQLGEQCSIIYSLNILPPLLFKKLRHLCHKKLSVTLLSSYLESFSQRFKVSFAALDAVMPAKVRFVLVYKIHHRIKTASENGILLIQLFLHEGFLLAMAISNFSSLSSCPAQLFSTELTRGY